MDSDNNNTYGHILKYTSIFGGVQGLNILTGLVRNKLVAVILGPSGMGLASLFNNTINLLSQATGLGIGISAVRNVSELYEQGDHEALDRCVQMIRAWSLLTALMGATLCMALGPTLSNLTFSWGDHSLHFILLAPAVALIAVTAGETAIMKGMRRLRQLAVMQVFNMLASLVISIPIYYIWGESGIVPVIVLMAFVSMLFVLWQSFRMFPLRVAGMRAALGRGWGMVRLGMAFMLAGVFGSGAEMLIRSYLNVHADLEIVGLYNAGYMITVTYAGMVFSAMETDYFPRLTSVNHVNRLVRDTANRQIEVSLLIVSPMLATLIIVLPVLVPLMFSDKFLPMVGMTQVTVLAMYFRAIMLPVEYIPLAKGESMVHLVLEAIYSVLTVVMVAAGYHFMGLVGTGIGFVASYMLNFVVVMTFVFLRYRCTLSRPVIFYSAVQIPLGVAAFAVTLVSNMWVYWLSGIAVVAACTCFSLTVLYRKTSLWTKLKQKVRF